VNETVAATTDPATLEFSLTRTSRRDDVMCGKNPEFVLSIAGDPERVRPLNATMTAFEES
jgi:hypothetical protein